MHDRDGGRDVGLVAGLTPDGRRAWSATRDAGTMAALVDQECCGRGAHRHADGTVSLE